MSAFDDEFGLFGEEAPEEEERRPTLGARTISSGETVIDEIEPEDERPARVRRGSGDRSGPPRGPRPSRPPGDPTQTYARAAGLLEFLAKKLVDEPDAVVVHQSESARGPIISLEVEPDDLGKVIGRGGRVAQALRTLVRASAEGRVIVDIVDVDDDDAGEDSAAEHDAGPIADAEGAASDRDPTD